jgi:predicted transcriptional regulator
MEGNISGEELVFGLIEKNNVGLTITELVSLSKLSRSTVRVALARFEGAAKISFRKVGMAKVYCLGVV